MAQTQKTIAKTATAKTVAPAAAKNTASKGAANKTVTKAPSKAAKQQTAPAAVNIAAMVIEGIAKRIEAGSRYYMRALQYHKQAGTVFPRARHNERRAALKVEDVQTVFDQHDKHILAAGNGNGQAMFDIYMMSK